MMNETGNGDLAFGEFKLDPNHRRLLRDGEAVPLGSKAFDVLEFLVMRNGEVVEKDEILDNVWPGQFIEEANLPVQISAIRKALGETAGSPRFLITVPGKGYKFTDNWTTPLTTEIVFQRSESSRVLVHEEIEEYSASARDAYRDTFPISSRRLPASMLAAAFGGLVLMAILVYFGMEMFAGSTPEPGREENPQPVVRRLTNHGRTDVAVISPDGKFFAYSFLERGGFRTELRLAQTDGGGETVLRPLDDVRYRPKSFSADGAWLYYIASRRRETKGTLFKIPILGGVPQKLAEGLSIYTVISPDEKAIAFFRPQNEGPDMALVLAGIDGRNERIITVGRQGRHFRNDSQSFSPDGGYIAVSAAIGSGIDGSGRNPFEVFVVRVSDGSIEQLTALEWNSVDNVEWLRDGSGLIAVAQSRDRLLGYQLWKIAYPSGEATLLSRDANSYGGELSISSTSQEILVIQREVESNIFVGGKEEFQNARQITFGSSGRLDGWNGLDWLGKDELIHTAWVDQSLTIWKKSVEDGTSTQLTSVGFRDERPSASADGKWFVFESNRSGKTEIWRAAADGSESRQLTRSGDNTHPSITPDGNWVFYRHSGDEGSSIWRVQANGGEPERVSAIDLKIPRLSPDGRFIAGGARVGRETRLVIASAETGEIVSSFAIPETANFRFWLRWTANGGSITYPDEANGIWRQAMEGGSPIRVGGLPEEKLYAHAWSPDGRVLAFGRVREVREAVLVANVR